MTKENANNIKLSLKSKYKAEFDTSHTQAYVCTSKTEAHRKHTVMLAVQSVSACQNHG